MCDQVFTMDCGCCRNQQEFDQERERQAAASQIEHRILDMLRGEACADPHVQDIVVMLRADPLSRGGNAVVDVHVSDGMLTHWWSADGNQHDALRLRVSLKVAA